jgi:hypothetical protein
MMEAMFFFRIKDGGDVEWLPRATLLAYNPGFV